MRTDPKILTSAAERKAAIAKNYAEATTPQAMAAWEAAWDFESLMELHDMAAGLAPSPEEMVREATSR